MRGSPVAPEPVDGEDGQKFPSIPARLLKGPYVLGYSDRNGTVKPNENRRPRVATSETGGFGGLYRCSRSARAPRAPPDSTPCLTEVATRSAGDSREEV